MNRITLDSIGSLFSASWDLYKGRFNALLEIMILPVLIMATGFLMLSLGSLFALLGAVLLMIGIIFLIFSEIAIVYAIDKGTNVDASYHASMAMFWPMVWIGILSLFSVMGGFIMLIVPGIFLSIAFSFILYTLIIEKRHGVDALRQSKEYVKGYWWAILGRTLLLGIIFLIPYLILEIPITLIAGRSAGNVVSLFISLLFTPFSIVYRYVIYKNLKTLKPELAEAQTKSGRGFILISAIVGLVVPILLVFTLIGFALFHSGSMYSHDYMNSPSRDVY